MDRGIFCTSAISFINNIIILLRSEGARVRLFLFCTFITLCQPHILLGDRLAECTERTLVLCTYTGGNRFCSLTPPVLVLYTHTGQCAVEPLRRWMQENVCILVRCHSLSTPPLYLMFVNTDTLLHYSRISVYTHKPREVRKGCEALSVSIFFVT